MCDFCVGLSRQLNGSIIPSERELQLNFYSFGFFFFFFFFTPLVAKPIVVIFRLINICYFFFCFAGPNHMMFEVHY